MIQLNNLLYINNRCFCIIEHMSGLWYQVLKIRTVLVLITRPCIISMIMYIWTALSKNTSAKWMIGRKKDDCVGLSGKITKNIKWEYETKT